jgi:DNA topoisomerase-1
VRRGRGFAYVDPRGRPVRDGATLARVRALAIPPAWTDVWISPDPRAHLQATGRDARRRKQARYHPRWREVRDAAKFGRLAAFARALPRVRARVARDLARPGPPSREKVVAAVVRLLETTLVRVGNDEYARENRSYGLTTLRDGHAKPGRGGLVLRFPGKGGKPHDVGIDDPRLARIVRRCQELPGQRLFQYLDERGRRRALGSADVNRYLRETSGAPFTAKDFRTWAGTVLALGRLSRERPAGSATERRRVLLAAVDDVAARLRNTRAVCRASYVHPAVLRAWDDGTLAAAVARCARSGRCPRGLRREEATALAFLAGAGRPGVRARSGAPPRRAAA